MDLITGTNMLTTLFKTTVNLPTSVLNLFRKIVKKEPYVPKSAIFSKNFKLNFAPFEFFKRKLLSHQINKQLTKIRKQDELANAQGVNQIPENHLKEISIERGLNVVSRKKIKQEMKKSWMGVSQNQKISNSALFWFAVLNFEKNKMASDQEISFESI